VTMYCLICKETFKEKILQRASQKSTVQRLVMTRGHVQGDLLALEDIVYLLIDDPQLEQKLKEITAHAKDRQKERGTTKGIRVDEEGDAFFEKDAKKLNMWNKSIVMLIRFYVNLQKLYQAKVEADFLIVEQRVRDILKKVGRDPYSISIAVIKSFSNYITFPGQFDGAIDEEISRLKTTAVGLLSDVGCNGSTLTEDLINEICRYGAAELYAVATYIGGVASQEIINFKILIFLITKQFVPMMGTFIFNGIDHKSQLLSL
ncbi:NEDD8-activating enzyme E1 regulatory subunit AXR1-like protein, partial [Tanacetum coccineum]